MGQYPPSQTFEVLDGQLNLPASVTSLPLVVGVCSGLAANTLGIAYSSKALVAAAGRGPAVNMAAPVADAGGVLILATAGSTAASNGSVTKAAVGSSTGTVTVSGTSNDNYQVIVEITTTGTVATGRFRYALDRYSATAASGWSPIYTIPSGGTFVLPNTGLTITFVPGAGTTYFEVGDTHRFDSKAAHYTANDLSSAFAVLLAQLGTIRPQRIGFAGIPASASAGAVLAAAAAGHLDDLFAAKRFCRAVMDISSFDTAANVKTAIADFEDDRIGLVWDPITASAGCRIVSKIPFTGLAAPVTSFCDAVFERFAKVKISESLARVKSGALRGVLAIGNDEKLSTQFTAEERIITACRNDGYAGFFVTKPWIKSAPDSSFRTLQWGMTLDRGCEVSYDSLQQNIEENFKTRTDGTGFLMPEEAARIGSAVNKSLRDALLEPLNADGRKGHVSGCEYTVTTTNNYLTDGTINGFLAATPLREAEGIATTAALVAALNQEGA